MNLLQENSLLVTPYLIGLSELLWATVHFCSQHYCQPTELTVPELLSQRLDRPSANCRSQFLCF